MSVRDALELDLEVEEGGDSPSVEDLSTAPVREETPPPLDDSMLSEDKGDDATGGDATETSTQNRSSIAEQKAEALNLLELDADSRQGSRLKEGTSMPPLGPPLREKGTEAAPVKLGKIYPPPVYQMIQNVAPGGLKGVLSSGERARFDATTEAIRNDPHFGSLASADNGKPGRQITEGDESQKTKEAKEKKAAVDRMYRRLKHDQIAYQIRGSGFSGKILGRDLIEMGFSSEQSGKVIMPVARELGIVGKNSFSIHDPEGFKRLLLMVNSGRRRNKETPAERNMSDYDFYTSRMKRYAKSQIYNRHKDDHEEYPPDILSSTHKDAQRTFESAGASVSLEDQVHVIIPRYIWNSMTQLANRNRVAIPLFSDVDDVATFLNQLNSLKGQDAVKGRILKGIKNREVITGNVDSEGKKEPVSHELDPTKLRDRREMIDSLRPYQEVEIGDDIVDLLNRHKGVDEDDLTLEILREEIKNTDDLSRLLQYLEIPLEIRTKIFQMLDRKKNRQSTKSEKEETPPPLPEKFYRPNDSTPEEPKEPKEPEETSVETTSLSSEPEPLPEPEDLPSISFEEAREKLIAHIEAGRISLKRTQQDIARDIIPAIEKSDLSVGERKQLVDAFRDYASSKKAEEVSRPAEMLSFRDAVIRFREYIKEGLIGKPTSNKPTFADLKALVEKSSLSSDEKETLIAAFEAEARRLRASDK